MSANDRLYSSVPIDVKEKSNTTDEKQYAKDLSSVLGEFYQSQWKDDFDSDMSQSLKQFQHSLVDKVKFKTFQKMNQELFSQEDSLADQISYYMMNVYRRQLMDFIKQNKKQFTEIPQSELQTHQEMQDTNVYLGYTPKIETIRTASPTPVNYQQQQVQGVATAPEVELVNDTTAMYMHTEKYSKEYKQLSSIYIFLFGSISCFFLYVTSPFLFFQEHNLPYIFAITFIGVSIAALTENLRFNKYKKLLSITRSKLQFRYFYFPMKIFVLCVGLSFLLFTDFNYHPMDFYYYTSPYFFKWNAFINSIAGYLQMYVSYGHISIIQEIILGSLLVILFANLLFRFFRKGA